MCCALSSACPCLSLALACFCLQLLSDAELSAVGRFKELTALTLNSEDGVMPGEAQAEVWLALAAQLCSCLRRPPGSGPGGGFVASMLAGSAKLKQACQVVGTHPMLPLSAGSCQAAGGCLHSFLHHLPKSPGERTCRHLPVVAQLQQSGCLRFLCCRSPVQPVLPDAPA